MTTPQPSQQTYRYKYGLTCTNKLTELELELWCFATNRQPDQGGLGRYRHFRNVCRMVFPKIVWEKNGVKNDWLEDQIQSLCDDRGTTKRGNTTYKEIVWAGCAAAGKTYAAALFAAVWWMAAPMESMALLTSTTAKMVRKRIWPVVQELYTQIDEAGGIMGHMVDSKTIIQDKRGDDKHAIFVVAVGEGDPVKAASNIQGQHARRIFLVLDEATDVREAILIAADNLRTACEEFIVLKIGNAKSRMDPLGIAMEPASGWSSITVDSEEWETKNGGHCLRFDGTKSPNVMAQMTHFTFLSSYEDFFSWQHPTKFNTLGYWMYHRGFPPPEGVSNTVVSEAMIENNEGRGKFTWLSKCETIAALDPGFGGDGCVLRFADFGDVEGGGMGIQLTEKIDLKFKQEANVPVDKQIAEQVMVECKTRGVRPGCFGMDSTGTGRGVFADLFEKWSSKIIRVEFGGAASDNPTSRDDPRECREVYDRRVTELWFGIRTAIEQRQLKGLDIDTIKQLCARTYKHEGKLISIEKKQDYKSRIGRSPDDADALAVLIEVARQNGSSTGGKAHVELASDWNKIASTANAPFEEEADQFSQPFESLNRFSNNRPTFTGAWVREEI